MVKPTPRILTLVGMRTWAIAAVAAISTYDPVLAVRVGPVVALLVFLTGAPGRLRITGTVIVALLLPVWAMMTSAWALYPDTAVSLATTWASLMIMFIATIDVIRSAAQLRVVAIGYLVGAVFTVARLFLDNPTLGVSPDIRATVGDVNANYVSYALVTGFAVVVMLWVTRTRRSWLSAATLLAVAVALKLGIDVRIATGVSS